MTPHAAQPAADPPDAAAHARLSADELLSLQLLARGYSPDQIAALRGVHPVHILNELGRAVAALRATNVHTAAVAARERGLIT